MKEVKMIYEKKIGKNGKYFTEYSTTNRTEIYEKFASCMVAKYINHASWVKSVTSSSNYDGTYNYNFFDDNNGVFRFTIER